VLGAANGIPDCAECLHQRVVSLGARVVANTTMVNARLFAASVELKAIIDHTVLMPLPNKDEAALDQQDLPPLQSGTESETENALALRTTMSEQLLRILCLGYVTANQSPKKIAVTVTIAPALAHIRAA